MEQFTWSISVSNAAASKFCLLLVMHCPDIVDGGSDPIGAGLSLCCVSGLESGPSKRRLHSLRKVNFFSPGTCGADQ